MFRVAELGQKVTKEDFDRIAASLRIEMVELQQQLRQADFPVIVVFAGVDGAGKGESVNLINEWMDPRWIVTRAYDQPSDEEQERPNYWRFWRDLPPKGQIGLFLSCWYSRPILDRVHGRLNPAEFDGRLDEIAAFEKTLADDGALILKLWMHLGKDAQKKRLKALEKDPLQSWRVTKQDWANWKLYDQFIGAAERTLMRTGTGLAPWEIIEGADARYRCLTVLTTLRDAIRKHLAARIARRKVLTEMRASLAAQREAELAELHAHTAELEQAAEREADSAATHHKPRPTSVAVLADAAPRPLTVLDALDMSQSLSKAEYGLSLKKAHADLATLQRKAHAAKLSTLLVFEGWDAAGKGGAIRRVTAAMDARHTRVVPIAAPTDEERAQHYLWRFWRHLPRGGRLMVFDRSWYGRVLVERIEGFATEDEWMRAYAEVNAFEEQMVSHGYVLCKFWLHVTKEEQYRRFKEREEIAHKAWKLTDEDWRNRSRWEAYELAVNDMVERTSTSVAPWTLVEGNDKNFARVKVARTVAARLKERLG